MGEIFRSFNDCVIKSLMWLVRLAPIGIASLIIEAVYEMNDMGGSMKRITIFALVCCSSIILFGTIIQAGLLLAFVRRRNPFVYYLHFIEPAIITAATTSGYVALQKGIEVCTQKLKMDQRIAQFSIAFFATLEVINILFDLLILTVIVIKLF